MLKIALVASLFVIVVHTQHPTHGTHAHSGNEHGTFKFVYDNAVGTMVMITHTHCYLMDLSDAEKMDVHDKLKMEALEMTVAALAADQTKQTAVTDSSTLDPAIVKHCNQLSIVTLTH